VRVWIALAGAALFVLLASGAATHHEGTATAAESVRSAAHAVTSVIGEHDHEAASPHGVHAPPLVRSRDTAFGVLVGGALVVAWASTQRRIVRSARRRSSRITVLPPGRAPPPLRIA
jgi:hypothetical protein